MVLEDVASVILALERLLQPCFGPDGLAVLLDSGDGHIVSTCNGLQIVTSVEPSGRLPVKAIKQLYEILGDGSKKFILMLAAALRELVPHVGGGLDAFGHRQVLADISWVLTHTVIPSLDTSQSSLVQSLEKNVTGDSLRDMCQSLAKTCIGNKMSLSVRSKVLHIISSLLFPQNEPSSVESLKTRIDFVRINFEEIFTRIPNAPTNESRTLPGFLLDRDFLCPPPSLPLEDFGVALVLTGLELDEDGQVTYDVKSAPHLTSIIHKVTELKEKLVQSLSDRGVRLVLCGEKIDPVSAHYLRQHGIGAVQMVAEETLMYIAAASGTCPSPCARDLLEEGSHFIKGKSCSYLSVGKTRVVHLRCEAPSAASGVLLCGATGGQCKQTVGIVRQILGALTMWCDQGGGGKLLALRGGGAWELAVARDLERRCRGNAVTRGSVQWMVYKALQKAFLAVPLTLLRNANLPSRARDSITTLHVLLGNDALRSEVPLGVDTTTGRLGGLDCPSSSLSSCWEPYWSQITLVNCVCDLLIRILRIDMVVKIPRSITTLNQRAPSELSSEEEDFPP